nr:hypothetical protein [Tanacetum cinerariifolium]
MSEPAVFQNSLYLHPFDGPDSLIVQEKLHEAHNYRSWRRAIEIGLLTKRKLEFIRGTVFRSATDANQAELWDTCNNMLEKRFARIDGSRKYKLNKDTYEFKQSGGTNSEYYTKMKCVWEELDSINVFPVVTTVSPEVTLFLTALIKGNFRRNVQFVVLNGIHQSSVGKKAIEIGPSTKRKLEFTRGTVSRSATDLEKRFALSDGSRKYKLNKDTYEFKQSGGTIKVALFFTALSKQKEEQRLFQFLNGLDEHYDNQRSQILMINPLPSVKNACFMLQQEESQIVLFGSSFVETTALVKGNFRRNV